MADHEWIRTAAKILSGGAALAALLAALLPASPVAAMAPPLEMEATSEAVIGETIGATATLSAEQAEGGSIEFRLFGPGAPECEGLPLFTSSLPVTGAGDYASGDYAPTEAGVYRWTAAYTNADDELVLEAACNAENTTSTVVRAQPQISTDAGPDVVIGAALADVATLSGGHEPTGEVTFRLYGPDDPACAGPPVFSVTRPLGEEGAEPGVVHSGPFTPAQAGEYRWVASYEGDAGNEPVTGSCDDEAETVTVAKAVPAIAAEASPGLRLGEGAIYDTATVSGGHGPTGEVTFRLYGPADFVCAGPPRFASTVPLAADGTARSAEYVPQHAGTYRWVATYGGDVNNEEVGDGCGGGGSVTIGKAVPSFAASAVENVTIGEWLRAFASLAGAWHPGGTIGFQLFGPGDPTCSRAPIFATAMPIHENGGFASEPFLPPAPGAYSWRASYSGDADNEAGSSGCGAAGTSTVARAKPTLTVAATASVELGGGVAAAARVGGYLASGNVTFQLYGPGDGGCAGPPVFAATAPLGADGRAESGSFTPAAPGTYAWRVSYSGDANNDPVPGACDARSTIVPRPAAAAPAPAPSPAPAPAAEPRAEPDLRLRIGAPKRIRIGAPLTYRLTVTNRGDARARGVQVRVRLRGPRSGAPAVAGAPCRGRRSLVCRLRALAPGDRVRLEITVAAKAAGRLTLHGSVAAAGGGGRRSRDRAVRAVAVVPAPRTAPR